MDRLKQIVPIWKREVWLDGDAEWVKPDTVFLNQFLNAYKFVAESLHIKSLLKTHHLAKTLWVGFY